MRSGILASKPKPLSEWWEVVYLPPSQAFIKVIRVGIVASQAKPISVIGGGILAYLAKPLSEW